MKAYYDAVKKAMDSFFNNEYRPAPIGEDAEHVHTIAASVMMTRDGVMFGGSFAHAVVENNLEAAVGRADTICLRNLAFFVYCKNHVHVNK
jgi:hypothetical protein